MASMLETFKPESLLGALVAIVVAFFGGSFFGGYFKWMQSKETIQPALMEQSAKRMADAWDRMDLAFAKQELALDEAEAKIKELRVERHLWKNAFDRLRGYTLSILRYQAAILSVLEEAGIDPPVQDPALKISVMELMSMDFAQPPEYVAEDLTRFGNKGVRQ